MIVRHLVYTLLFAAGFLQTAVPADKISPELAKVIVEMKDPDPQVRVEAFAVIRHKLGPRAEAAVPTLIELIKTNPYNTDHTQVTKSLAAIGRSAVVELVKLINTETNNNWRAIAIYTLRIGGETAPDLAVPCLVSAMNDPEPSIRYESLKALGRVCAKKSEPALAAVPEIAKLLHDDDDVVRHSAAFVLGSMGAAAEPATPVLIAQLDETDPMERFVAISTLSFIGPGARGATGKLIPFLKDVALREDVAIALRHIGLNGAKDVPALIDVLKHPQPRSRQLAASLLARIGPDARTAVQPLIANLDDKRTRQFAIDALGRIGSAAEPAVPHLTKLLTDKAYYFRAGAAEALGRIGSAAKPAIPALKTAASDTNDLVRQRAEKALVQIAKVRLRN